MSNSKEMTMTMEEMLEDAENWGNALNDAGWVGVDMWENCFGVKADSRYFNGGKGLYRLVIKEYIEKVFEDHQAKENVRETALAKLTYAEKKVLGLHE